MDLTQTRTIGAPPAAVWAALNDPQVLKACIPGCETLERVTDTEWRSVVATRIGPVQARFSGKILLVDVTPPVAYTLKFEGQGGAAGFANGEARVTLAPDGAGTALTYTASARVGGKIAQLGSRLVDGAAAKLADDFFTRFVERLAPPPVELATAAPVASAAYAPPPRAPWVRTAAIVGIVIVLVLLYVYRHR